MLAEKKERKIEDFFFFLVRVNLLPKLLHLLDLAGKLLGKSLLQGLTPWPCQYIHGGNWARQEGQMMAHLRLARGVATQAIESGGMHDGLHGKGRGTEGRSSQLEGGCHDGPGGIKDVRIGGEDAEVGSSVEERREEDDEKREFTGVKSYY
jgi:hypothetical protein